MLLPRTSTGWLDWGGQSDILVGHWFSSNIINHFHSFLSLNRSNKKMLNPPSLSEDICLNKHFFITLLHLLSSTSDISDRSECYLRNVYYVWRGFTQHANLIFDGGFWTFLITLHNLLHTVMSHLTYFTRSLSWLVWPWIIHNIQMFHWNNWGQHKHFSCTALSIQTETYTVHSQLGSNMGSVFMTLQWQSSFGVLGISPRSFSLCKSFLTEETLFQLGLWVCPGFGYVMSITTQHN